jgi:hypothetical protein
MRAFIEFAILAFILPTVVPLCPPEKLFSFPDVIFFQKFKILRKHALFATLTTLSSPPMRLQLISFRFCVFYCSIEFLKGAQQIPVITNSKVESCFVGNAGNMAILGTYPPGFQIFVRNGDWKLASQFVYGNFYAFTYTLLLSQDEVPY